MLRSPLKMKGTPSSVLPVEGKEVRSSEASGNSCVSVFFLDEFEKLHENRR